MANLITLYKENLIQNLGIWVNLVIVLMILKLFKN